MTSPLSNFITEPPADGGTPPLSAGELRRRRVFRVAAVYGGVAFVIIQII